MRKLDNYTLEVDESCQISVNELILALFGKPVSELAKEIQAGKNDKYANLYEELKTERPSA